MTKEEQDKQDAMFIDAKIKEVQARASMWNQIEAFFRACTAGVAQAIAEKAGK